MIEENYPQAVAHLRKAQVHKSSMNEAWNNLLDESVMEATLRVDASGLGSLIAYVNWTDDMQSALTKQFADCVDELWAALDSLVLESVQLFSSTRTSRDARTERYWPLADSRENLELLLEQACINGVLSEHARIIREVQPFHSSTSVHQLQQVRNALRQLQSWSEALRDGQSVTIWATPTEPTVETHPTLEGVACVVQPPFDIGRVKRGTVATFRVPQYNPDVQVSARPGTILDIEFIDGNSWDRSVSFATRQKDVIRSIAIIHAQFARATTQVAGTRALPLNSESRRDLWTDATESGRQWSRQDLDKLQASGARVAVVTAEDLTELTLLIPTPSGVYERKVPNATHLRTSQTRGIASERAVHEAVATWGLPDFVMKPRVERKGSGVREVGDGLLVAGNVGAIVQVKARSVEPLSEDRERNWINKNIDKAVKQVEGTHRRLQEAPIDLENGRGRHLLVDGRAVTWVGVVVIDHPRVPKRHELEDRLRKIPCITLMRRDWEFLFEQLKSTTAVIRYLLRVAKSTDYLGEEPHRYFDLAALDAAATAVPTDPKLAERGQVVNYLTLPLEPAGAGSPVAFGLTRLICEDIAGIPDDGRSPGREVDVFAAIDALPVTSREALGVFLMTELEQDLDPGTIRWKSRIFRSNGESVYQVSFAVCSEHSDKITTAFRAWVFLRHSERVKYESIEFARSVAILLTPRRDSLRPWDTTLLAVEGDLDLSEEELEEYEAFWAGPDAPPSLTPKS
jgi:hypothetical protein